MKRRTGLASIVASLLLVVLMFAAPLNTYAFSAYGNGTSTNPYRIATCTQLQEINNNLSAYYTLVSNIDCSGMVFTSIAISPALFTGTIDGLNHTISHLTINDDGGLIAQANGATVKNLTIDSGTITGNGNIGSFIGYSQNSSLDNVHSSMTINAPSSGAYIGGLVGGGVQATTINKSSYSGTISGGSYIGGLVGYLGTLMPSANVLSDSYFDGILNVTGDYAGGVVGILYSGTVSNTYGAGTINVTGTTVYLGGFIGITYKGATNNNFSATLIHGTGTYFGGFFGIFFTGGSFTSTRSNNYFDQYRANDNNANSLGCANIDEGSGSCTSVNAANASPSYFKNNHTNSPLNDASWEFTNIWQPTAGYPTQRNISGFAPTAGIPNNGDANGDGTQDSYQANVLSVQDGDGTWATITVPAASGCTLGEGSSTSKSTIAKDGNYSPITNFSGFSVFCPTAGASVSVTVIYNKQYGGDTLRHYNSATGKYSDIPGVVLGTQTIGGIVKTTAAYSLTDGGPLDTDGSANGIIKDPVGLSSPGSPNTGFGTHQSDILESFLEIVSISAGLVLVGFALRRLSDH